MILKTKIPNKTLDVFDKPYLDIIY